MLIDGGKGVRVKKGIRNGDRKCIRIGGRKCIGSGVEFCRKCI